MREKMHPLTYTPYFSIIITTYNRELLLKRAIDSIIAQTYNDWEAIVVDDGSTDNTHALVLPYLKEFPNINYLRKTHSGESMTKNVGIQAARGQFITFLDSDDEYRPEHLDSRKNILIQNPKARFLYGGVEIIGNQFVPDRFDPDKLINLRDCVIGGTFFIERETLLLLKGFRKILLGPDADLFDRACSSGVIMIQSNLPTYIYHHETEDSITNTFKPVHRPESQVL